MPDAQLSPQGFRVAATALRERPVEDPENYTEPTGADPNDPECRVCFVGALSVGFPTLDSEGNNYHDAWYAALRAVEAEVERLPAVRGRSMTQALDAYGPEFCAQLCEGIADEMEAAIRPVPIRRRETKPDEGKAAA